MSDRTLAQERTELFNNAIKHKKNTRIPTFSNFFTWRIFDSGYKLSEAMLDYSLMEKILREFQERYNFDAHFDLGTRNPLRVSNAFGGGSYLVDDDVGSVTFLDKSLMNESDYSKLIEDPIAFSWETIFANSKPDLTLAQLKKGSIELLEFFQYSQKINEIFAHEYECKLGLDFNKPISVPFETLYQTYRGMLGISKDMRRNKKDLKEALEILFERDVEPMLATIDFSDPGVGICSDFMIFMGHSILNPKQFDEFYWPYFKRIFDKVVKQDGTMFIFCEAGMLRFADFFNDLPKGYVLLHLEEDNIFEVREKVPNLALAGGMTSDLLGTATPHKCIDYAKKLIDEVGDGYVFSTNKMMSFKNDCKRDNLLAVMDFVHDYQL